MRLAGFGPVGNARLDREKVDAYRFTVVVPHDLRDTVEGAIEFRSLTCVDDGAPDDRCAVDSGHDDEARASCQKIDGVRFQTSKAYERVEWGYQSCCELCARDPRCLYFAVDTTFVPLALEYPSCYLFDHVELERPPWLDVTPPAGEAFFVEAFWVADADRTSITPRSRLWPTPAIWPRSTRRRSRSTTKISKPEPPRPRRRRRRRSNPRPRRSRTRRIASRWEQSSRCSLTLVA